MCDYSIDFIVVRRAVFWNFIARNAPIREEDLTPAEVVKFINAVGENYADLNKRGLGLEYPERHPNVDSEQG